MGGILITQKEAICIITISNEEKRNAVTHKMATELLAAFNNADGNTKVRVVIVTGEGDIAFSSGHDLNEPLSLENVNDDGERAFTRPLEMRKPVIAAVNGYCYAAGFILALACDLRIASENAIFASPGAKLGMLPTGGQIARLPQLISQARALELMFTSQPITANKAYEWGLLNQVVPQRQSLSAALQMAEVIAANSPVVISAVKKGVADAQGLRLAKANRYERTMSLRLMNNDDAKEGVKAFFEKRQPRFADLQ
jgi:enoyl-CoA hydratase